MEQNKGRECKNCSYFRQHYIWRNGYMEIEFGHCVHPPRIRHCRPRMKACEKWCPQTAEYKSIYVPLNDIDIQRKGTV